MKKSITLGLAFTLAISSVSPIALADGVEEEIVDESENIENEENDGLIEDEELEGEEELEEEEELVLLDSLSLETALEFALEDNFSLQLLNYQLDLIESQVGGAGKTYGETSFDIRDLERTLKRLNKANAAFADRIQVQNQLDALEKQITAIEDALEQVKSGKVTLTYSEGEARESIKMATIVSYTQLLMAEEQQELRGKVLETKEKEVGMMKRQYELGALSRNEYTTELREIDRQQTQIELAAKEREEELAEFALDLGIIYHTNLALEPLDLSGLKLIEQEVETEELIENSFKYKSQIEAIELAQIRRDIVYGDKDADEHDRNQADLSLKIEQESFANLKVDGATTIRQIYYDIEDGYQAILDAERELKFAQEDSQTLKRRYELGVVSRVNYELASIRLDQAELTLALAKESYFLMAKKVDLLEAGVL